MNIKHDLVSIIRRTQTIVSIIIFFIVLFFCWEVNGMEIKEIQLSYWGANNLKYGWLWNAVIILLSLSIFFNNIIFIHKHVRLKRKTIPYILFSTVGVCLFFVGYFNLDDGFLHDFPAWLYFFLYPLAIFTLSFLNRTTLLYREWLTHMIFSVLMIISPLIFINFEGLAISEILHTIIVCFWNIHVAFKNF